MFLGRTVNISTFERNVEKARIKKITSVKELDQAKKDIIELNCKLKKEISQRENSETKSSAFAQTRGH